MIVNADFWRGKRVCVTGGTGFLGFQLVRQLRDAGARVRNLSLRPRDSHPLLDLADVEQRFGDVCDARLVRDAVADCDVVFHTAGLVAAWGPALARMHQVHQRGTQNVLDALRPGSRVVHTSSVVAVGASSGRPLTESDPWNLGRLGVDYVQAKRRAEELALEAAAAGSHVVVVNPGYLIGPEDYENSVMGRLFVRFWKGRVPLAPPGGFNLVDVRDVATGHLLAAERGAPGRRYILGGENVPFSDLLRYLARVASFRPRGFARLPHWAEWLVAAAAELYGNLRQREPYPALQHARLHRYVWYYDWSRAYRELGFAPRPLLQSLRDSYTWHSEQQTFRLRGFQRYWLRPAG
jgi:dihydroflavonol-4-reductase